MACPTFTKGHATRQIATPQTLALAARRRWCGPPFFCQCTESGPAAARVRVLCLVVQLDAPVRPGGPWVHRPSSALWQDARRKLQVIDGRAPGLGDNVHYKVKEAEVTEYPHHEGSPSVTSQLPPRWHAVPAHRLQIVKTRGPRRGRAPSLVVHGVEYNPACREVEARTGGGRPTDIDLRLRRRQRPSGDGRTRDVVGRVRRRIFSS